MNASRSHFPNPIVRLIPELTDGVTQAENELSCFAVEFSKQRGAVVNSIENFAVHRVEHLKLWPRKPRRIEHPTDERLSLVMESKRNKGAHGERRISQPAEPVVPISNATDPFRKGSGWRSDQRTRRSKR